MKFQRSILAVFAGVAIAACSGSSPPVEENKAPATKEEQPPPPAIDESLYRQALDRGTLSREGYQLVQRSRAACNSGKEEDIRYLAKKVGQDTAQYAFYSVCVTRNSDGAQISETQEIRQSPALAAAEKAGQISIEQKQAPPRAMDETLYRQAIDRGLLLREGYQLLQRSRAACNSAAASDIKYLVKKVAAQDSTQYDLYSVCVSRSGSRADITERHPIRISPITAAAEAAAKVAAEQKRKETADSIEKADKAAQDAAVAKEFADRDAEYALTQKRDSVLLQRAGFEIIGRAGSGDCNDDGNLVSSDTPYKLEDPSIVYTMRKIGADQNLTYIACVMHSKKRGPIIQGPIKMVENIAVIQTPAKAPTP